MTKDGPEDASGGHSHAQGSESFDRERREALIKLGKYTAYATPIVVGSVSVAHSAPISKAAPAPPPGPPPPPPGPPPPPSSG